MHPSLVMIVILAMMRGAESAEEGSNGSIVEEDTASRFLSHIGDKGYCENETEYKAKWPSKPFKRLRMKHFFLKSFNNSFDNVSAEFLGGVLKSAAKNFTDLLHVRRSTGVVALNAAKEEQCLQARGRSESASCRTARVQTKQMDHCTVCSGGERQCGTAFKDFPNHTREVAKNCMDETTGVDTDFVVYVAADECAGRNDTLALASACAHSELDKRPIAGLVTICYKKVKAEGWNTEATLSTINHELLHAFVFSSGLFDKYYDYTGSRLLTERTKTYVRTWKINSEMKHDHKAVTVVTPAVMRFARDHFNCTDLDGAEIENDGGDGTAGSHWEKRLFGPEVMTGMISRKSYLSHVTAALLEDSGWYRVNWNRVDTLFYGKSKGCVFARQSCREYMDSQKDETRAAEPYCNWEDYKEFKTQNSTRRSCSPDRAFITFCRWTEGADCHNVTKHMDLKQCQYFKDKAKGTKYDGKLIVGSNSLSDGCNTWSDIYYGAQNEGPKKKRHGDTVCANNGSIPDKTSNWAVEIYDKINTACFEHDGKFEAYECSAAGAIAPAFESAYGAGCYRYKCHKGRLLVQANDGHDGYDVKGKDGKGGKEDNKSPFKVCWSNTSHVSIRRQFPSGGKEEMRYHKGNIKCPSCEELCHNHPGYKGFKCEPGIPGVDTTDTFEKPCIGCTWPPWSRLILGFVGLMLMKADKRG